MDERQFEAMQAAWQQTMAELKVDRRAAEAAFSALVAAYGEAGRDYHNLNHIGDMLGVLDALQAESESPVALQLATWFHDAVYDPLAKDNEERSAAYAVRVLDALGVAPALTSRVYELIMVTKTHQVDEDDRDAKIMIDADLAPLGAPAAVYDRQSRAIRREYAAVHDAIYCPARQHILNRFLARERIYQTGFMYAARERRARQNIGREVRALGLALASGKKENGDRDQSHQAAKEDTIQG